MDFLCYCDLKHITCVSLSVLQNIYTYFNGVHIISTFCTFIFFYFSQHYRLLNFVYFCVILYTLSQMLCPPNSPCSFQGKSSLFYRIFVLIPKVCILSGFLSFLSLFHGGTALFALKSPVSKCCAGGMSLSSLCTNILK